MKSHTWLLFGFTVLALIGTAAWGQEPSASNQSKEQKEQIPPAGTANSLAVDLANYVLPGQTLAAFTTVAHSNLLGMEVAAVEAPLRAHLDLKEGQGVVVTSAAEDSAAAKAGLKPYDIVVRIDDQPIASPEKFHELAGSQQGKKVVFHILRQGKAMEVGVTMPNTPVYQLANDFAPYAHFVTSTDNQYRIGVTMAPADDVLRSQLRLAEGEGLVITEVVGDGPAAKAGLRPHDVLVKLDGKRLTTVEACNAQIQEVKDRKVAAVYFRGGKGVSVEIAPQLSATHEWRTFPHRININTMPTDGRWLNTLNQNVWVLHDIGLESGRPLGGARRSVMAEPARADR